MQCKQPTCWRAWWLVLGAWLVAAHAAPAADPPRHERAAIIRLQGVITPLMEQFLYRKLDEAQRVHVDLLVLEIDSPGGFTATTLDMADRIRAVDGARTVAYVPRQAISGGAILCLACDDLLMAPEARVGDAGEIMLGEDNAFRYVPEKQLSLLARQVRDLAEATGKPPALAEAMVNMDLVVYKVRHRQTGELLYLSQSDLDSRADREQWERLEPVHESREKHFLTLNGSRAVELQLAVATAASRGEVLERYGVQNPPLVLEPTAVDTAVIILNAPLVTGLIFVIGLIALYIEFSAPGIGVGGLIAGLCFAMFFWSRFLGGTADWLEVLLFAAGLIFIAVELFVIPGFGVAGLSGLLLVVVSMLMASQHFLIPSTQREWGVTVVGLTVITGSGLVFLCAALLLGRFTNWIPGVNLLALEPPRGEDLREAATWGAAADGAEGVQVGDHGVTDSALRPAGKVRFGDQFLDVVSNGAYIDAGRRVRIQQIQGNRIVVAELDE